MEAPRSKVLLIDDDPFFRKVLSDAFAESGFTVVTAQDGMEGVEVFLATSPDVVISDLIMPKMGGVEAIQKIHDENSGAEVIILTTYDSDEHIFSGLEAGAKGYLLWNAEGVYTPGALARTLSWRIVEEDGDVREERILLDRANVHPINQDLAPGRVIKARDE